MRGAVEGGEERGAGERAGHTGSAWGPRVSLGEEEEPLEGFAQKINMADLCFHQEPLWLLC